MMQGSHGSILDLAQNLPSSEFMHMHRAHLSTLIFSYEWLTSRYSPEMRINQLIIQAGVTIAALL